ncbi:hypothetical protein PENTCL1PPCAC_24341, partial [Pristionchus entomophagus]
EHMQELDIRQQREIETVQRGHETWRDALMQQLQSRQEEELQLLQESLENEANERSADDLIEDQSQLGRADAFVEEDMLSGEAAQIELSEIEHMGIRDEN